MSLRKPEIRTKEEAILQARYELARRNLLDYCKLVYPGYEAPTHVLYMIERLEALERGDITRLMICMPPRHSKSLTASQIFPTYFIGKGLLKGEQRSVLLGSYAANLSKGWGGKAKQTMTEYGGHVWGASLDPSTKAKDDWKLAEVLYPNGPNAKALHKTLEAGMATAGVGGPFTGKGADCLDGETKVLVAWPSEQHQKEVTIEDLYWEMKKFPNKEYLIKSWNEEGNKDEWALVKAIIRKSTLEPLVSLEVEHESGPTVTINHPVYSLEKRRYLPAIETLNHQVLSLGDDIAHITDIRVVSSGPSEVFDIQVERNENFYADGLLVHNCLIIDDPVKGAEEAASEVMREKVWEWYSSDAFTRLMPGGRVLVIMTMWHLDDLANRLIRDMDEGGEQWEIIKFPAICVDENDILGRKKGEALWPERFPANCPTYKAVMRRKHVWSSLYQQDPRQPDGNLFKADWFRYYTIEKGEYVHEGIRTVPSRMQLYTTSDQAFSTKTHADYTVVALWGFFSDRLWLLDMHRGQYTSMELVNIYRSLENRFGVKKHWVEKGAFTEGKKKIDYLRQKGIMLSMLKPRHGTTKDKVARADSATPWFEEGKVLFPAKHTCRYVLEDELLSFPRGPNDDQVDAVSYGVAVSPWGYSGITFGDGKSRSSEEQAAPMDQTPFGVHMPKRPEWF